MKPASHSSQKQQSCNKKKRILDEYLMSIDTDSQQSTGKQNSTTHQKDLTP
jgi:hypothetical protein